MHARSFLNVGGFLPAGFPVNPAFSYFEMLKNSLANSQNMANYAFQSPLHHLDRLRYANFLFTRHAAEALLGDFFLVVKLGFSVEF